MIITIGGLAGSGTTTLAEVLSKELGYEYISAGHVFRQLASEHNMSVIEFNEYAEGNTDIDIELDKRQAKLAKEAENLIVEGRLSAYFVEADFKVWLHAPFDVRASRIMDRESKTEEIAKREIRLREASEALRYKEIHDIDISNMDVYDMIINTDTFKPDSITKIILTTLKVI